MKTTEFACLGFVLLGGLLLLIRSSERLARPGRLPAMKEAVMKWHLHATGWMIGKGFFPFPGVRLASPQRGWIAGEATFLSTLAVIASSAPTPPIALLSLAGGTLLAVVVLALAIREEAKKQVAGIRSNLPIASFLLSLMLEAGMGSSAAMQEVVKALPGGALSGELGEIVRSRMLGGSREKAMDKSISRVPLEEYLLFLNLVRQGERLGVGFSQGLRELSARMMESRQHRAESLAQKAAVKLLFPLVIFIFPSVFLILLSPVILKLFEFSGR